MSKSRVMTPWEAVIWLAFGVADLKDLDGAPPPAPGEVGRKLADAKQRLFDAHLDGKLRLRGRYSPDFIGVEAEADRTDIPDRFFDDQIQLLNDNRLFKESAYLRGTCYLDVVLDRVALEKALPQPAPKRHRSKAYLLVRPEIFQYLSENGRPGVEYGEYAAMDKHIADWLANRKITPAKSTIQEYRKLALAEYVEGESC